MQRLLGIFLILLSFTTVSCASATVNAEIDATYASLLKEADVVFMGRVDYISDVQTDQNAQIAFTVQEALVDHLNVGSGLILTAVPTADLAVGREYIIFAKKQVIEQDGHLTAVLMPVESQQNPFMTIDVRQTILDVIAH